MKFLKWTLLGTVSAIFGAGLLSLNSATAQQSRPNSISIQNTNALIHYPKQVLELFTSQGCSSCPSANQFTRSLSDDTSILTLSYSVDYWDYLGWKDTFTKPEFTNRQRHYGARFQGQVYTPQMVVNGKTHNARYSRSTVKRIGKLEAGTNLQLSRQGDKINIKIEGVAGSVMAVYYTPGAQSVSVKRGENHGRTLMLSNVVTKCTEIFSRKNPGAYTLSTSLPPQGKALAILVQNERAGSILAAATYIP